MKPHEWQELPWDVRWRMGVTIGVVMTLGAVLTLCAAVITGEGVAYFVGSVNAFYAINVWKHLHSARRRSVSDRTGA